MTGLYLYCVREKNGSGLKVQGINGGKIRLMHYKDIEAVVSDISLENYSSREIQKKAQEDLSWIKEKAEQHERVIRQAMRKNRAFITVIPMKFGTIFKTKDRLEASLQKHYAKFKKILERLKGKQEWGVKMYIDRKVFASEIKKISPEIQKKIKEAVSLPEGEAYFLQKEIDEAVRKQIDSILPKYTENIFKNLKKHTVAATRGKLLDKELTGKPLPMILNAIFMVSQEKLKGFIKEVDAVNTEYNSKGFCFELSGPWPPYHFVA